MARGSTWKKRTWECAKLIPPTATRAAGLGAATAVGVPATLDGRAEAMGAATAAEAMVEVTTAEATAAVAAMAAVTMAEAMEAVAAAEVMVVGPAAAAMGVVLVAAATEAAGVEATAAALAVVPADMVADRAGGLDRAVKPKKKTRCPQGHRVSLILNKMRKPV